MAKFVFISDFDGTLTERDFYHMVIDKYLKDWGWEFYTSWRKEKAIDLFFLNKIFTSTHLSEEELEKDILEIPLDPNAVNFIQRIKNSGGDFVILSAGTSYYIEKLLKHKEIEGVRVISNDGVFKKGGIHIEPDKESPYYSAVFGIEKRKAVEELKKQYEQIFFAGDSKPDLEASMRADVVFAKSELQSLLTERQFPFIPVDNFTQIEHYMMEQGWLNEGSNP